ncbi:DUF937 domain-containing protein [Paludibaculum fermentans]|uniref:DUF937 domain-containing protein n=1 Tax=Paludibaculum fermentans TaxID=1473598 RepID=A0A7S7NLQ2_PALFE|nr:DUF937 domain-containing protein [Paludibaculum fermentans]QOY85910.1 hypothetical protein IRI77_24240 [Paludibaculum fermentans]
MDLLENMLQGGGGDVVRQLAGQFGLDESQVSSAVGALLPALQGGAAHEEAAAQAAASTGLDSGLLQQLAPLLSSFLGGQQGGQGGGLLDTVTSMLDRDKDGSALDDVLGMAQKFMQKE